MLKLIINNIFFPKVLQNFMLHTNRPPL